MVEVGDTAPGFTAPLANGDIDEFTLSDRLDEAPLVLAFFPGAFTSVCSHEMSEFGDRIENFEGVGATVYGVSVDSPFALNEFRDKLGVEFGMISDDRGEIIEKYGVSMDFAELGVHDVAKRSVLVIDGEGELTYKWVSDDPGVEPDYDEVEAAAGDA